MSQWWGSQPVNTGKIRRKLVVQQPLRSACPNFFIPVAFLPPFPLFLAINLMSVHICKSFSKTTWTVRTWWRPQLLGLIMLRVLIFIFTSVNHFCSQLHITTNMFQDIFNKFGVFIKNLLKRTPGFWRVEGGEAQHPTMQGFYSKGLNN